MIRIATHSGSFHSDDIGAVAALCLHIEDDTEIIRTRDDDVIDSADYVVDVGGEFDPENNRFDHHQKDYDETRENGIPYAAFGLVWREFGEEICGSQKRADIIDQRMVQPIDAHDNGIEVMEPAQENLFPYDLYSVIAAFRSTWKEEGERNDEAFQEIVNIAQKIISREITTADHWIEGTQRVEEAYEKADDKQIIILDNRYPWKEVLFEYDEPVYVLYPDPVNDIWRAETVRKDYALSLENRKDFPEDWAGKRDEALQRASGVDDAVFCHSGQFLVGAGSKEGALELARKALNA